MTVPARAATRPSAILVEPGTVKMERLLPGPIERVWEYIVDGKKRALWLAGGEFDLRLGGAIKLEFDNAKLPNEQPLPEKYKERGKGHFEGKITRLEPLRVLAHTWNMGGDSEVTYELTPRGKDVLLTVVHRRLAPRDLVIGVMGGWDVHTGILADLLNGTAPRPFWKTHDELQSEYAQA